MHTYKHAPIHTLPYITSTLHLHLHYITSHYITCHDITVHWVTVQYITVHYITLIHTYIPTYIPTYLHTYMHTYMDIHTCYVCMLFIRVHVHTYTYNCKYMMYLQIHTLYVYTVYTYIEYRKLLRVWSREPHTLRVPSLLGQDGRARVVSII